MKRQKLMYRKFHLNMGKNFTVQVNCTVQTVNWKRLPREVVQFSSLEILKQRYLNAILQNALWRDPAKTRTMDQMTHCGPFQPNSFCDSVNYTQCCPTLTQQAKN